MKLTTIRANGVAHYYDKNYLHDRFKLKDNTMYFRKERWKYENGDHKLLIFFSHTLYFDKTKLLNPTKTSDRKFDWIVINKW